MHYETGTPREEDYDHISLFGRLGDLCFSSLAMSMTEYLKHMLKIFIENLHVRAFHSDSIAKIN